MVLQVRSLSGDDHFQSKFVRVGNEIHITDRNDLKTLHIDLAKKDKIYMRIEDLKSQNPDYLDGGIIFVSGIIIRISSASTSLGLPITDKARKQTIQVLRREYPSYSIKELAED